MLENYRKEIECFGKSSLDVTKWWIDTIKYELDFGTLESAYKILDRATASGNFLSIHRSELKKIINRKTREFRDEYIAKVLAEREWIETSEIKVPKVNFDAAKIQNFAFKPPLINYIKNNQNNTLALIQNLYKTCKYFYKFGGVPICHRLTIDPDAPSCFFEQSLFLNSSRLDFEGLNNLCVTNFLQFRCDTDRKALSKLLPRLCECDVDYLLIDNQDLTIAEFKSLCREEPLGIKLVKTRVFAEDGTILKNEKLGIKNRAFNFYHTSSD